MKHTYHLLGMKAQSLPQNRFAGRNIRGSKQLDAIKKRDRRLRKFGLTVTLFAS